MKLISGLVLTAMIASFVVVPTTPVSAATIYKYEWVAQSGTISPDGYAHQYTNLVPGQTLDLWLTLTNRSGKTIVGKSGLPIEPGKQVPVGAWGIGTQNPQDGTPYFLDTSSFILNNNRFVYYDNENLGDWADGQSRTMGWTIKLANNLADGVHDLYYRPVSEYLAWTQQVKNGYTLPGTDSDIFTRLIVGSGVSSTYLTYTNQQYGFSFDYPQPISPARLTVNTDRSQIGNDLLATIIVGVPDTGSASARVFVWSDSNLNNVVAKVESQHPGYAVSYLNLNNISWTVLKGHQDYADANYEVRIGKLPNDYIIESLADGWFSTSPDQRFLNSLKSLGDNLLTYSDYTNKYSIKYPSTWVYNNIDANHTVFYATLGDIWEFDIKVNTTSKTLQENVNVEIIDKVNGGYTVTTQNIIVSGEPAVQLLFQDESQHLYGNNETMIVHGGKLYTLFQGTGDNNQTRMFNSFNFL